MNSPRKPSGVHATVPARPRDPFGHQGKVLAGRYRLDALLGSGGMAEVYAATHLRLGMPLAVKVLRSSSATSPNLMDRFAQEAKGTARLQHENIVRILDYGSEGPLAFIVMERLEGVTLSSRIDADGPPPLPTVRAILEQLCDALSAAHLAGVVHRDLKPANVMLVPAPGGGELIKVLDFGLARITEVGPSRLTQTGEVAGTPQYMSPEQCRSLDVGPATDIYALGCILTELLQGAPLFDSPAPVDVIAKHLFLPVPPLNRSKALPFVPAAVLALRRAMLAKEPEERPATAALVKARLCAAFAGP
ncbi:MAG: serine/threonine protein kinase [Polyangiaceae bacterium]|nr:serine/threonine protein kinase [Polyangiaceae bacterium]